MTTQEMIQTIQKLKKCIGRDCKKRQCSDCELHVPKEKKIVALEAASKALARQQMIKAEFFKSGIEYAKTEFKRTLQKEKGKVDDLHRQKEVNDFYYTQVLGLQKAIELADEVKLDEGLQEK